MLTAAYFLRRKEYRKCLDYLDMEIVANPFVEKNYWTRSLCLEALGLFKDSLSDAEIAFQISKENGTLKCKHFARLASAQIKLHLFKEARTTLNYSIIIVNKYNYRDKCKMQRWMRELDDMRRYVDKALKLEQDSNAAKADPAEYFLQERSSFPKLSSNSSKVSVIRSPKTEIASNTKSSSHYSPNSSLSINSAEISSNSRFELPKVTVGQKKEFKSILPNASQKYSKTKILFPVYHRAVAQLPHYKAEESSMMKMNLSQDHLRHKEAVEDLVSFLGTADFLNDTMSGVVDRKLLLSKSPKSSVLLGFNSGDDDSESLGSSLSSGDDDRSYDFNDDEYETEQTAGKGDSGTTVPRNQKGENRDNAVSSPQQSHLKKSASLRQEAVDDFTPIALQSIPLAALTSVVLSTSPTADQSNRRKSSLLLTDAHQVPDRLFNIKESYRARKSSSLMSNPRGSGNRPEQAVEWNFAFDNHHNDPLTSSPTVSAKEQPFSLPRSSAPSPPGLALNLGELSAVVGSGAGKDHCAGQREGSRNTKSRGGK